MDRCTRETRHMLQRILSGWHELALVLPNLEQHLAETTGYPVHVAHRELSLSAGRIARFLVEEHGHPSVAIGHLHDWLVDTMGAQLRCDWVAFLALVREAPGLTADQRADLVVIADVLRNPPVTPMRTGGRRLIDMVAHARAIGSPTLLLEELDREEPQLALLARAAVEKSRHGHVPEVRVPRRRYALAAVGATLLLTAGVVTAVVVADGPPELPGRRVAWSPSTIVPGGTSDTTLDVPAGAHRLVARIQLTDPNPATGTCPDLKVELSTLGQSSGWHPLGSELSVPVPPGRSDLKLTLALSAGSGCTQQIETQQVDFER